MSLVEQRFLDEQEKEIAAFADESDILDAQRLDRRVFQLRYRCVGLVEEAPGRIVEHREFHVGVFFHEGYQRTVIEPLVLTLQAPRNCWHPNVRAPFICVGPIAPSTTLVELATRAFELITFQSIGPGERDALRAEACPFVRRNFERFPIDPRPLKWRDRQVCA